MSAREEVKARNNTLEAQKSKLAEEIKDACSEFRSSPDWTKNMEIVDELNHNPHLCSFAVQEIRLLLKTKNPEIEILALTLTEGVIKNCPSSHGAIAQRDFMRYLVKVALNQRKDGFWKGTAKKLTFKKEVMINKDHIRAQTIDKALLLLRMLNDAYQDTNLFPIFHFTYKELLNKGIRFPEPTKDEDLKIFAQMDSSQNFSGMGSIPKTKTTDPKYVFVDRTLPMIRPAVKIPKVTHPGLNQAQETAVFLYEVINNSEVGTNLRSVTLIQDLIETVKLEKQNVETIASSANIGDTDIMHAFGIIELITQVLNGYEDLVTGKKRRFEEVLNVAQMFEDAERQNSRRGTNANINMDDSDNDSDNDHGNHKHNRSDNNNGNDDERDSKHEIKEDDVIISPPQRKQSHKRESSKKQVLHIDLLGIENDPSESKRENERKAAKMNTRNSIVAVPKSDNKPTQEHDDLLSFFNSSAPPPNKAAPKTAPPDPLDLFMSSALFTEANSHYNNNDRRGSEIYKEIVDSANSHRDNDEQYDSKINNVAPTMLTYSFDSYNSMNRQSGHASNQHNKPVYYVENPSDAPVAYSFGLELDPNPNNDANDHMNHGNASPTHSLSLPYDYPDNQKEPGAKTPTPSPKQAMFDPINPITPKNGAFFKNENDPASIKPKPFQPIKPDPSQNDDEDPFQELGDLCDAPFAKPPPKDKPKSSNPFDVLEDPFSSMGSIKRSDPSKNPFAVLSTDTHDNQNGEQVGNPFAEFM